MSFEKAREERRFIQVPVSYGYLIQTFTLGNCTGGIVTTTKGVPANAELEGAYYTEYKSSVPPLGTVYFVFCHPSFDKVESDDIADVPILTPEMSLSQCP